MTSLKSGNEKLQLKLQQLLGELEKPPHNLSKVKDIRSKLAGVVSDVNELKRTQASN